MRGKPADVLNGPVGSGSMPSKIKNKGSSENTSKLVVVLNRLVGNGVIPGKRDIINTLLWIWLNQTKIPSAYIYIVS